MLRGFPIVEQTLVKPLFILPHFRRKPLKADQGIKRKEAVFLMKHGKRELAAVLFF